MHGGEAPRTGRDTSREDTAGLPEYVDWEITRALLQGAKTGGIAPRLREELTEEDRSLLETILTGAIATERRLAAANLLKKSGASRNTRNCPHCDARCEEDSEHIIWKCAAWRGVRAPYLQAIETAIHRTAGTRAIKPVAQWHRATRSLLIFPEDPELTDKIREVAMQVEELRVRNREDWEGETRLDEMWEEGKMAVFTDGGAKHPEYWKIRRASYGIFYGEGHAWIFCAPLVGRVQTVARAELRAALWALEWAREPVVIVSDNKWTVDGIKDIVQGKWDEGLRHIDLWRRVKESVERLGANNVAARWTKGHAGERHFQEGTSNPEDSRRNEAADALVQLGAQGWALPDSIAEHFLTKRRIAIVAQRMAIECLRARLEERARMEQDEILLRMDMMQAFLEHDENEASEQAGQAATDPQLTRDDDWLRRVFPGFDWEGGQRPAEGEEVQRPLEGDLSDAQWKYLPYSLYAPMRWYWSNVGWTSDGVRRGRCRGTTWLQLACDFEASTGSIIFAKTQSGTRRTLSISAKARQFALASMHLLRKTGGGGQAPARVVSLSNLVPIGAGQAAGIAPAVRLLKHKEVSLFLARQLAEHPLLNKPTLRWRWHAMPCRAGEPIWDGCRQEAERFPATLGPSGHIVIDETAPTRSLSLGHGGGRLETELLRSSVLHHGGVASGARKRRYEGKHFEEEEKEVEGSPAAYWEGREGGEPADGEERKEEGEENPAKRWMKRQKQREGREGGRWVRGL